MQQDTQLFQEALALHQQAKLLEAKLGYEKVLSINPNHFGAHNLLGAIALQMNQYQQAIDAIDKAIAINPQQASAYNNRGIAFKELSQFKSAVANYQMAIKLKPEYAEAYYNQGIALKELQQFEAAVASYDIAIKLNPNDAETYYNRGIALKELEQFEAAIASYNLAIQLRPNYADAYMNRGNAQLALDRYAEAVDDYDRSIQIRPNYAQAYYNRGNALQEMRQLDAAIASYDQATALDNNLADAFLNKSLCLLLKGDFAQGWPLYEWRWQTERLAKHQRHFSQDLWLGQTDLKGKTLLVHSEQGLGDTIQFCRYLRLIKEVGAHIIFEVPRSLYGLLHELDGVDILLEQGQALPHFDYHCPLLSLPLACKDFIKSMPSDARYVHADAGRLATWQQRLGTKTKPRIGLVWSGNADHRNDHKRSIPLSILLPYLSNEFDYICLQKEVRKHDKAVLSETNILCFEDELKDFGDTAALIELMDVVISVDTSVAHLAGALGKSSCLLLAYLPDWRWGLDTCESIWYQSLRLYRQDADRTWPAVLAKVANDLERQYLNR